MIDRVLCPDQVRTTQRTVVHIAFHGELFEIISYTKSGVFPAKRRNGGSFPPTLTLIPF